MTQRRVGFFVLSLFFVSLFCVLGVWQLHRYHDKKNWLLRYEAQRQTAPQPLADHPPEFQAVRAEGQYVNALTILVQNRFYKDQLGFEVLTPLRVSGQSTLLLVDRGWIPKNQKEIEKVVGKQVINGYVKFVNEYQFTLGKNILNPKGAPLVIQKIAIEELSGLTHETFYPFIVRLDKSAPHGYVRDWTLTTVLPERHLGYAIQWFLMAIAIAIAYICFF